MSGLPGYASVEMPPPGTPAHLEVEAGPAVPVPAREPGGDGVGATTSPSSTPLALVRRPHSAGEGGALTAPTGAR